MPRFKWKDVSQGQSRLEMRSKCNSGHHSGPGILLVPCAPFPSLRPLILSPFTDSPTSSPRIAIAFIFLHSCYYVACWCRHWGFHSVQCGHHAALRWLPFPFWWSRQAKYDHTIFRLKIVTLLKVNKLSASGMTE